MSETNDRPPRKRLRFTGTYDAHNLDDLHDVLRRAAMDVLDLDGGQRETREVASGDGHFTIEVINPEPYPREQYDERLMSWHDRMVAERRAKRAAANPSRLSPSSDLSGGV
jgi:hypothetical protein